MNNSPLSTSDFNKQNLIIPDIKIDDIFLQFLLGLNVGIVHEVDHYINTVSSSKLNKISNIESMSDLKNPLEGQTQNEFKKMLKYFEKCEDVFINAFKTNGFSDKEAINQWVIYANIINIDEGHRFLRITLRYSEQNNNYLAKLANSNPNFKDKIYNLNKFGFDVNNEEELKNRLIEMPVGSSGCMLIFITVLALTLLI